MQNDRANAQAVHIIEQLVELLLLVIESEWRNIMKSSLVRAALGGELSNSLPETVVTAAQR